MCSCNSDITAIHGGETRRYNPRDGGGRISSGIKSRATQDAEAERGLK
jgi:hypothetical protein